MEPQIRYATSADGTRIAYAGQAGTRPTILLIHGWPLAIGAASGNRVVPKGFDHGVRVWDVRWRE